MMSMVHVAYQPLHVTYQLLHVTYQPCVYTQHDLIL